MGAIKSIGIVAIIFVASMLLMVTLTNVEDASPNEGQNGLRALTPHDPIRINSDDEFDAIASSEGWSGNGGYFSPYIIENYEIDGHGRSAIYIGNTTKYFILRYSHLYNDSSSDRRKAGALQLHRVQNGYVLGCNFTNSLYGVYITTYSSNNKISYSSFYSVTTGIALHFYVSSTTIEHNEFHYSVHSGTAISMDYGATDNEAWYNTIDGARTGIYLDGGSARTYKNFLSRNTITNVGEYGIYLYSTLGWNRVENNTIVTSNYEGIRLYARADDTRIVNNTIRNCHNYGIEIHSSNNVLIYNNSLLNNNGATDTYDSSHVQAYNNGTGNSWYYKGHGNYWADWTSPDGDNDGIVDNPYILDGDTGSQDPYPLAEPSTPIPELSYGIAAVVILLGIVYFLRRR